MHRIRLSKIRCILSVKIFALLIFAVTAFFFLFPLLPSRAKVRSRSRLEQQDLNDMNIQKSYDVKIQTEWDPLKGRIFASLVSPLTDTILIHPSGAPVFNSRATVFVLSLPKSFEMREAIRNTWARDKFSYGMEVFFFLGITPNATLQKEILQESETYGDIVQDNMTESYFNLPLKVARAMKFYNSLYGGEISEDIHSLPLFVKVDENVFVNFKKFFEELAIEVAKPQSLWRSRRGFIAGKPFIRNLRPVRKPGRPFMPYDTYPFWTYPTYLSGPFYAIEGRLVAPIYKLLLQHTYFPFEDILVTGFIAIQQLHARLIHLPHINMNYAKVKSYWTSADYENAMVVHHISSPQKMTQLFENVSRSRR